MFPNGLSGRAGSGARSPGTLTDGGVDVFRALPLEALEKRGTQKVKAAFSGGLQLIGGVVGIGNPGL